MNQIHRNWVPQMSAHSMVVLHVELRKELCPHLIQPFQKTVSRVGFYASCKLISVLNNLTQACLVRQVRIRRQTAPEYLECDDQAISVSSPLQGIKVRPLQSPFLVR